MFVNIRIWSERAMLESMVQRATCKHRLNLDEVVLNASFH